MKTLLQHFTVYFPYGEIFSGSLDKKVLFLHYCNIDLITKSNNHQTEAVLRDMNAAFCELTSLYLLVQEQHPSTTAELPLWTGYVVDHVLDVFGWSTTVNDPFYLSLTIIHG
jgi:hypothetical protein